MSLMDTIDQLDQDLMIQAGSDFETRSILTAGEKPVGAHVVERIDLIACTATCKCGATFHRPTAEALSDALAAHAKGRIAQVSLRTKL